MLEIRAAYEAITNCANVQMIISRVLGEPTLNNRFAFLARNDQAAEAALADFPIRTRKFVGIRGEANHCTNDRWSSYAHIQRRPNAYRC